MLPCSMLIKLVGLVQMLDDELKQFKKLLVVGLKQQCEV